SSPLVPFFGTACPKIAFYYCIYIPILVYSSVKSPLISANLCPCHTYENPLRNSFACHTSKTNDLKSFACHTSAERQGVPPASPFGKKQLRLYLFALSLSICASSHALQ